MRTPRHWYRTPGLLSALLSPLGALYAMGTARRLAAGPRASVGVPVICVGNLTAGGTGKTPLVMALAGRLPGVHIVSRGYGGTLTGPTRVDPANHTADQTGDEPLLLAAFAPTWIAADRAAGARAAVEAGATAILLDDGFQNPALAHDLSILAIDAARGFGNGRVIPAGPLREPLATGLARADLAVAIGPARRGFADRWTHDLPLLTADLTPLPTGMPITGAPVLAFAGIGAPEKFFATLRALGADIRRQVALADHQPLPAALMTRLEAEAKAIGALLVTTEKDAVRLPPGFRQKVTTIPVRLTFDDPAALDPWLEKLA
ncbi:tetraacyldisaccharide 4'-kinase [Rhodobacterales bacterium HKCCE3408]|nr:tetraacyldisaccharide 4'-kinase [Rhodobacterales bacterium HKCCE3408]